MAQSQVADKHCKLVFTLVPIGYFVVSGAQGLSSLG